MCTRKWRAWLTLINHVMIMHDIYIYIQHCNRNQRNHANNDLAENLNRGKLIATSSHLPSNQRNCTCSSLYIHRLNNAITLFTQFTIHVATNINFNLATLSIKIETTTLSPMPNCANSLRFTLWFNLDARKTIGWS